MPILSICWHSFVLKRVFMKSTLILLLLQHIAYIAVSQTTLVNYNGNSWKDPKTWIFQKVPADTNDVVLVKDILINTNAVCRSLTTNGFSITVANGFKLTITGADSSSIADSDSLLSVVKFYYLDGEPINDSTETEQTLYNNNSSLKC